MKPLHCLSLTVMTSLLMTACDGINFSLPPVFSGTLQQYAVDNGSNVPFTVNVLYNPTSVSCFDSNLALAQTGTNQWSGTASYTTDLVNHASGEDPGTNYFTCTAGNAFGTTTSLVGFITLIPNVVPNIVMLPTQTICGNDGSKTFNKPLVDFTASTYVTGATYTLTAGDLPPGLSINSANGNLVGTTTQTGNYTVNPLKITATTMVDADESGNFSISFSSAPCP